LDRSIAMFSRVRDFVNYAFHLYTRYPLAGSSFATCTLMGLGDVIAQKLEHNFADANESQTSSSIDPRR
jgi:hypothetical protein